MVKLKRIVLFEPSISSLNLGDYVIVESVKRELGNLLGDAYVVEQPTQTPLMHWYQKHDRRLQLAGAADYRFVCGSNLFWQNMLSPMPQWNMNLFNCIWQKGAILVGVGSGTTRKRMNPYTVHLYKKVLSREYVHSVRDEATKEHLERIGLRAINTGCVTTWSLTEAHCRKIPTQKRDHVVFTLTDYLRNIAADRKMLHILMKNYDKLYFWPQGYSDYAYLSSLGMAERVSMIAPNLNALRDVFGSKNVDYVGTRLHGGIFAMQNEVRSMIISIDNRARDMRADYHFPCVEREQIETLETVINGNWKTSVDICEERIRAWKAQFDGI